MNIGVVVDNEFFNDERVKNEVEALIKSGRKVHVLCYDFGNNSGKHFHEAKIEYVKKTKYFKNKVKFISNSVFDLYSIFWAVYIYKFVRKYKIDILHSHDLHMAKPTQLANKLLKIDTIIDLHENYPFAVMSYSWSQTLLGKLFVSQKRWFNREKKYLPMFSKIIVLSQNFKNELINRVLQLEKSKFIIFPNYPNTELLLSYKIQNDIMDKGTDFIVFYFGGIGVRRGIFILIDALKLLVKDYLKIKLLVIGPVDKADETTFNKEINHPDIKNNIYYFRWKDFSLLPSYITISDICVSPLIKNPQHDSGIANKVFQYMLFGKPVIVSNCKPQEEVITNENAGLVFESGNAEDLSQKILTLHKNSELCKKLGENGRRAVLEKYNLKHASKRLVKYYGNLYGS